MNYILLLEDASSAPFNAEDFLNKIFGNFWSLLINLLALIVLFLVLFFLAYKPLRKYVEKRRDYIDKNIHDAEVAKTYYEEKVGESSKIISDAHKEGQEILKKAEENAQKEANAILNDAKTEASLAKEKAFKDIEQEKEKARIEIQEELVSVALDASKEILGREINSQDNEKLVAEFAKDLERKD